MVGEIVYNFPEYIRVVRIGIHGGIYGALYAPAKAAVFCYEYFHTLFLFTFFRR